MNPYDTLMERIRSRRTVRKFRSDPIPREELDSLIEAAAWAPSASNRQDWFFTIVESQELRREMEAAVLKRWEEILEEHRDAPFAEEVRRYSANFTGFVDAPLVIAVSCAAVRGFERSLAGDDAFLTVGSATSAALAAQNLMLAADALGLATRCMTGSLPASRELKKILGLSRKREIVCLIALGHPAESPPPPPRKVSGEIMEVR